MRIRAIKAQTETAKGFPPNWGTSRLRRSYVSCTEAIESDRDAKKRPFSVCLDGTDCIDQLLLTRYKLFKYV